MALSSTARTLIFSDSYTWNGGSHQPSLVTYSFANAATGPNGTTAPSTPWAPFNDAQQAAARQAVETWGSVSGIQFVEVPDTVQGAGIDLRFQMTRLEPGYAGMTYYPQLGDVSLNIDLYSNDALARGSYGYLVLLHEIGHGLGLKHPFDNSPTLPDAQDNFDTTVMSYPKQGFGTPDSLRAADVEAIQYLYGTQQDGDNFSIHWSWDAALGGIRHQGNDSAQTIEGTALRDVIFGLGGDDTLLGHGGNDVLYGGAGTNRVNGGSGIDTMGTDLFRQQVTLTYGSWSYQSDLDHKSISAILAGGNERTTGNDIEVMAFFDGRLVFDGNDPAAQVMRLYQAALGRLPDPVGRDSWTDSLAQGAALTSLAQGFLDSQEFQSRYGALDNAGFVARTYQLALGRDPDAQGMSSWLARLDGGMSRAELLQGFSESVENRGRTDGVLSQGLWDADRQVADIARLYQAALGRAPDADGLRFWDGKADAGESLAQIADQITQSNEFSLRFPNVSDADFVRLVYQNTLGRPADAMGEAFWLDHMAHDMTRSQVVTNFASSTEFLQVSHSLTENGITFA
ncbi:DUF4214 domain-containing protein [Teichococcus wenyumeiae]|uniref:DUF4214 domain-containing protein n=1 Tax=Teichococcus wenyumeiae TaxID=2478470 RepID=UPI0011C3DB62|nr:DUF4214 domain-containing protein [Pseudoroseomonas wenyumeiae]